MSKYYTNECVDCDLPCIGNSCRYKKVEHHKCDICGNTDETDMNIIETQDLDLCENCYKEKEIEKANNLQDLLYEWYVLDWLESRNLTKKDVDEETGVKKGPYKDCIYACFEEFLDNEYEDDDFIEYLCEQNGYKNLEQLCEDYEVDIDYMY